MTMELEAGKHALFEQFLSELSALDDFRTEYSARYDFQGLGRDDQDVQRLIEAMAFYRARTRLSVEQGIVQYKLHALEQLFPYLLSPMPAMALLHPILASNMTDSRILPLQAELVVSPPPSAAEARVRTFRTWHQIPIFPLRIVEGSVRLSRKPRSQPLRTLAGAGMDPDLAPWTLALDVAPSPTGAASKRYFDDPSCSLRELCLYMNPNGDVLSALRLFDAVQQSCKRVTARFFADGTERFQTGCSRPRVGTPAVNGSAWENPIEAARRVIHFPLAQLCLRVPLAGAPSEWTRLSIELELDGHWPNSLSVSEQSFLLNAVPVENLVRRSAEPIVSDGTDLESRVQAPENTLHLRAREVLGVYASDPDAPGVREALFPRALLDEGYAVSARGSGSEREVWIETDAVLGVVGAPGKLYVDAEWYDPDARLPSAREAIVRTDAHDLGALTWRLADPLEPPNDSPVMGDAALLDRLLDLQGRGPRSARDLKMLFQVLGVDASEVFRRIPRYIEAVSAGLVPDAQSHGGSVRCYDVVLAQVPAVLLPAARLLFSLLPSVLATWTGDAAVRVSVAIDATAREAPWAFDWRSRDDG
jgi:type VI secretion system protein ImpG